MQATAKGLEVWVVFVPAAGWEGESTGMGTKGYLEGLVQGQQLARWGHRVPGSGEGES